MRISALSGRAAFVVLLLFITAGPASAAGGRAYLDVSGGYKTGDFGTTVTTDLEYLSATLGYASPEYDISVTMPYLLLSGNTTEHGVGDVILRGGRLLVPAGNKGLSLDGSVAVKFPTADETKGLGTGEPDYGAFLGLHQRLSTYKVSLLSGYIWTGNPPGVDYRDIYLYGVGISKQFARTQASVSFEGRQALIPGAKNPQEVHAGIFHILNANYAVKASGFLGLNDGGPSNGFELGFIRWF
jgi:hypothetical protein